MAILLCSVFIGVLISSATAEIMSRGGCVVVTSFNRYFKQLTSDNYPQHYDRDLNQCWKFQSFHTLDVLNLTINDIDIEPSDACEKDEFIIRDGPDQDSPIIFDFCDLYENFHGPYQFQSTGAYFFIQFKSDGYGQRRGFDITYGSHETGLMRHSGSKTRNNILIVLLCFAGFSVLVGLFMICIESEEEKAQAKQAEGVDTRDIKQVHDPDAIGIQA